MKGRTSFIFTGNKESCTGCGACVQLCKQSALSMQPDSEGFLFPKLDINRCVDCGLCDRTCPAVNNHQENENGEQHCFVATTDNKKYYLESASIGICTMLSHQILSQGGYVFGAYLDEETWTTYHVGVSDEKGVEKIRNSKYLQSATKETFFQARDLLMKGIKVLYVGTPCQIAGLKSYLRKEYENLYTVDIVCHGVFSPKLMKLEVDYWEKKYLGCVKNFRFRSKRVYKHVNGGMVNFDLVKGTKTKHIERFAGSSPTYRCYAYAGDGKQYNQRLSCYDCPFKDRRRYADITVGDPWLINNNIINNPILRTENAVRSLYFTNTRKGEKLIDEIKHFLLEEELSVEDAFCQPALIQQKREIPSLRAKLFSEIDTVEYGSLIEKLLNCDLDQEHISFHNTYRKQAILRVLRRIRRIMKI